MKDEVRAGSEGLGVVSMKGGARVANVMDRSGERGCMTQHTTITANPSLPQGTTSPPTFTHMGSPLTQKTHNEHIHILTKQLHSIALNDR